MEDSNYEKNLKLNYEAIIKDVEILLISVIPTQKNLIQMYLWLNTTIIGVSFLIYDKYGIMFGLMVLPIVLSAYATFIVLKALDFGRVKTFIHVNLDEISTIESDNWEHTNGINRMLVSANNAFKENGIIVTTRAKFLQKCQKYTQYAMGSLLIACIVIASVNLNRKENKKVSEPIQSEQQKPVALDSAMPTTAVHLETNSRQRIITESTTKQAPTPTQTPKKDEK